MTTPTPTTQTCGGCRFFDVIVLHEDEESDMSEPSTICRRLPPIDGWSTVLADDWCGEWRSVDV